MLVSEKIETAFLPMLQRSIRFFIDGKGAKQGKLLLISQKGAYICFVLADKNNQPKMYEIPYPYNYKMVNDEMVLDYTLRTLCNNKQTSIDVLSEFTPEKRNRFYDSTVIVKCVDSL